MPSRHTEPPCRAAVPSLCRATVRPRLPFGLDIREIDYVRKIIRIMRASSQVRVRSAAIIASLCLLVALLHVTSSTAAAEVDAMMRGPLADRAEVIADGPKVATAKALRAHRRQTQLQLAVLTLPSTEGEEIDALAHRTTRPR